jgi:hypothetical protein
VGLVREGQGVACARDIETVGADEREVGGVRMLQCFVPSMRVKLMYSGGFD